MERNIGNITVSKHGDYVKVSYFNSVINELNNEIKELQTENHALKEVVKVYQKHLEKVIKTCHI